MGSNIGWFIKASCKNKKGVENKNIRINTYGVGMAAILVSKNWRSWRVNKVSSMYVYECVLRMNFEAVKV